MAPTTPTPDPTIFFLSDYGTQDEFVGVVHAVLHRRAPGVRVIDLSHQVPPFDVAAGAALLERSAPHLGPGAILAVVDPGVGTGRRAIAIAVGTPPGPGGSGTLGPGGPGWLVGPDNGLLVPAAQALGGPVRAIDLVTGARPHATDTITTDTGALPHRPGARFGAGATFDGRDVFAPAAAHLVTGGDPGVLGPDIDPGSLVPTARAAPVVPEPNGTVDDAPAAPGPSVAVAPVTWVDRFGNAQLGLGPEALVTLGIAPGDPARVIVRSASPRHGGIGIGSSVPARRVGAFGELGPGELGLMTDANGSVALVLNRASAARHLDIAGPGVQVEISPDQGR